MDEPTSSPLRLRVLGGFQLTGADGTDLSPPGRKLRALIALLALGPDSGWPRERLTALLWGDRDEDQARGSLRQALAELRRSLGDAALKADRETVGFNPGAISIDAHEFAALAATGDTVQASTVYRGDLLDGVSLPDAEFADWLLIERTRLHDIAVGVLGRLLSSQSGEAAATTAQRLLRLEPANEEAHRALMRHYAACGDRAHALRQFQLCRDSLHRDLGVKPEPETEKLYRELQSAPHNGRHRPEPSGTPGVPQEFRSDGSHRPAEIQREQAQVFAPATASGWRTWRFGLAALALLVATAVAAALLIPSTPPNQGRPVMVILPFKDLTGNPPGTDKLDFTRIGAGIAEEFNRDLSTFPEFDVVSNATAAAYTDNPIPEIAKNTGAIFIFEGTLRHTDNMASVNLKLTNGKTGISRSLFEVSDTSSDPVALQKHIAEEIRDRLGGMSGLLRDKLVELADSKLEADRTEYDYYILGHAHMHRGTEAEVSQAGDIWKQGLSRFPHSVLLRCKLSFVGGWFGRNNGDPNGFTEARRLVAEAIAEKKQSRLDEWYIHYAQAILARDALDREKITTESNIVRDLAPYDAMAHADMAWGLKLAWQYDDAVEAITFGVTHDRTPRRWYFYDLADIYQSALKMPELISLAEAQLPRSGTCAKWWYEVLGDAYLGTNQTEKAREAWKKGYDLPILSGNICEQGDLQ